MSEPVILILILCGALLAVALVLAVRHFRRPFSMDDLEGHDFEYYCADLLKGEGFTEIRVTNGSRDYGADILAQRDGVLYAVQCKRYDRPVGIGAVQEIYAARDYYGCMVGVVMTNAEFTEPAKQMAEKLKILLWDRRRLKRMEHPGGERA
ncbi:MAG: restriction endonuclease [Lachnospiraceae bacterium]|nr:restriction endonuclease [Lachnospiraceae bacterium]